MRLDRGGARARLHGWQRAERRPHPEEGELSREALLGEELRHLGACAVRPRSSDGVPEAEGVPTFQRRLRERHPPLFAPDRATPGLALRRAGVPRPLAEERGLLRDHGGREALRAESHRFALRGRRQVELGEAPHRHDLPLVGGAVQGPPRQRLQPQVQDRAARDPSNMRAPQQGPVVDVCVLGLVQHTAGELWHSGVRPVRAELARVHRTDVLRAHPIGLKVGVAGQSAARRRPVPRADELGSLLPAGLVPHGDVGWPGVGGLGQRLARVSLRCDVGRGQGAPHRGAALHARQLRDHADRPGRTVHLLPTRPLGSRPQPGDQVRPPGRAADGAPLLRRGVPSHGDEAHPLPEHPAGAPVHQSRAPGHCRRARREVPAAGQHPALRRGPQRDLAGLRPRGQAHLLLQQPLLEARRAP
mmetsp:Transcript_66341/g.192215  ORF Transcript_66341/g.192215 Transcript_66341/m.192215 type:complete len:417 (+) Transcript_66341:33-1283(+)